jgi:hypothetical protein
MAPSSTQSLTDMNTKNISYRVKPAGAETIIRSCADYLDIWETNLLELSVPVQALLYLHQFLCHESVELCCLFPIRLCGVLFN